MPQAHVARRRHWDYRNDRPFILPASSGAPTWEEGVRLYLRECRARGLSMATLEAYEWALVGNRTECWRQDYHVRTVEDLRADALISLEADLRDAGLGDATINDIHRRIKAFAKWCHERYGVAEDVQSVRTPKVAERDPEFFSPDEEAAIYQGCVCQRDEVMLELMIRTGVRLAEVCKLSVSDVMEGPGGWYLRIRQGKGRKDRIVPLDTAHSSFSRKLRRYIEDVRPTTLEPALFVAKIPTGI